MLRRQRLLESENHLGEAVGDVDSIIRTDFEDSLVQMLEDCHRDGRLNALRSFLQGPYRGEFPSSLVRLALGQDSWGWYMVHYYTCILRRMAPRWEHSANRLKDEFQMDPKEIPSGQEWLHR